MSDANHCAVCVWSVRQHPVTSIGGPLMLSRDFSAVHPDGEKMSDGNRKARRGI